MMSLCSKNITNFEANSLSPGQEISHRLWILLVHYRVHKGPPLVRILRHVNSVHPIMFYFFNIYFSIIIASKTGSSQWAFPVKEENVLSRVSDRRRVLDWQLDLLDPDTITVTEYHNVHPLQQFRRTQHKAGNGFSACVSLQHSSGIPCHQFITTHFFSEDSNSN
jgi:hypothetical protein